MRSRERVAFTVDAIGFYAVGSNGMGSVASAVNSVREVSGRVAIRAQGTPSTPRNGRQSMAGTCFRGSGVKQVGLERANRGFAGVSVRAGLFADDTMYLITNYLDSKWTGLWTILGPYS